MAYWAALRHARGLDGTNKCRNPGCGKTIKAGCAYCWPCALFGGQRKIKERKS
jgi:hypothetical protein